MSLLHYIDNEPPWAGPNDPSPEWSSKTSTGGAGVVRSASAAWPERGAHGLLVTVAGGAVGYLTRVLPAACAELAAGFWLKLPTAPTWTAGTSVFVGHWLSGANSSARLALYNSGGAAVLRLRVHNGAGATTEVFDSGLALTVGRWHYLAVLGSWGAAQAAATLYVDGSMRITAVRAGDATARRPDRFRLGCDLAGAGVAMTLHLDELKVRDDATYPEPFAPPPLTGLPEARRTVVLFRQADAASAAFAADCAGDLGIPRANLCPLPNAGASEHLADYAAFQSQVENGLAAWLARHPTVAGRATTFLVGLGVPGSFGHAGVRHSTTSRLMRYGSAFSSGAANPLHAPSAVSRLTVSDLRAAGVYLAGRIDAADLAGAQGILAAGAAPIEIEANAVLMTDEAAWAASLAAQRLRTAVGGIAADLTGAAFVFGDAGQPTSYVSGGPVAAFADDSPAAAETLRSTLNPAHTCAAALDAGWASAIGSADTAVARALDVASFFEMLRLGGTVGEAAAVAAPCLDDVLVVAGNPLLTVAFPLGGCNLYRGVGGVEDIDWSSPIAHARPGQTTVTLPEPVPPGSSLVLACRSVSDAGIEEQGSPAVALVEIDPQGNVLPPAPVRPAELTAAPTPDGQILIGFSYRPPPPWPQADGFDVFGDGGTGVLDLEAPLATIEPSADGQTDFELLLPRPEHSLRLAVGARAAGRSGPLSGTVLVPAPAEPAGVVPLGGKS